MHHLKTKTPAALTCALALLLSTQALASGFYLPGHGIRPLGRAGAYVVSGEQNLNSLWHNPANLAGMEDLQLTIDLALINLSFDFQRAPRTLDNGDIETYEQVSNEAAPKPDPQILIGGKFFIKNMSWAFGVYAPYLSAHTFPEKGAQRYVLVDNDGSLAGFFHFALAYALGENMRFGAGIQIVPASFKFVNMASGYTGLFGKPEDPDLDILSEITLTSILNFSGNMGFWVRLSEHVQAAISVQLPVVFSTDDSKMRARLPSHPAFNNAKLSGDSLAGSLEFPLVVRGGLRYMNDSFDLELALVYENWSAFDEIRATPNEIKVEGVPGLGSIPVGPLSIPQNWTNTYSVRLGGDFNVAKNLILRAGYAFDSSAVPDEYYSVFIADGNKHLLSLGGTYEMGSWSIDAGFGYYLIGDRTITNSKVRQINPTDEDNVLTTVIGNGEYSQTYMAGGLGVNYTF
jgi:long-chain fatty acid transport protein